MQQQDSFFRFSRYFKIPKDLLLIAHANPHYDQWLKPKKNGDSRLICAPSKVLKSVQRKISARLSDQYLDILPKPVMGFVKVNDWEKKRDIIRNARKHLGHDHMVNMDIRSFFPSITAMHLDRGLAVLYGSPKFSTEILYHLVLHNGSLPPGAPTSPILSNIAFQDLDWYIQAICKEEGVKYTRYVDDLTFSSDTKIPLRLLNDIREALGQFRFDINPEKTSIFGPSDEKTVTGIGLKEGKIVLAAESKKEFLANIRYYHQFKHESSVASPSVDGARKLREMKKSIRGQLEFARRVEGGKGEYYNELKQAYEQTLEEKDFVTTVYI